MGYRNPVREHKECFVAINKKTGSMFGGKAKGTHIGYPKIGPLKSAMTNANIRHEDYHFVSWSFNNEGVVTLTRIEEDVQ